MGSLLVRDGGLVVRSGTLVRKESVAECECCPTCSACSGGAASFATVTIAGVQDTDPPFCPFVSVTECADFLNREIELPLVGTESTCRFDLDTYCRWSIGVAGATVLERFFCFNAGVNPIALYVINTTLGEYVLRFEMTISTPFFGGAEVRIRLVYEATQPSPFDCSAGTYTLTRVLTGRACFGDPIDNASWCDFSGTTVSVTFGT